MLLDTLKEDCEYWIASYQALFMNECEIQLRLSHYLMDTKHYDKVHVEYAVPLKSLVDESGKTYVRDKLGIKEVKNAENAKRVTDPMDANMYIDIVVEKGKKFAAVELKYATTLIDQKLSVFGGQKKFDIIKDKSAQDLVRYDYWYDVCRIEAFTRFRNFVGGVAIMVNNDRNYWTAPSPAAIPDYAAFSMREGTTIGLGTLNWKNNTASQGKATRPAFQLDNAYTCHWKPTRIPFLALKGKGRGEDHGQNREDRIFKYMITEIEKK